MTYAMTNPIRNPMTNATNDGLLQVDQLRVAYRGPGGSVPGRGPSALPAWKSAVMPIPEIMPCTVRCNGLAAANTANLMLDEPALRTRMCWAIVAILTKRFQKLLFFQ